MEEGESFQQWGWGNWALLGEATAVLGKTLESPLDFKEIEPVNMEGNQLWILIGRTEAEAPILWPLDAKSWLTRKDPDAGKNWGQEEKGVTEDEMVWWHPQLNGHEFEQTPGDSEGQGSLACCSSWGLQRVGHCLASKQQLVQVSLTLKKYGYSVRWCVL